MVKLGCFRVDLHHCDPYVVEQSREAGNKRVAEEWNNNEIGRDEERRE